MYEKGDLMSLTPKCDMFLKNAFALSSPSDTFPKPSNSLENLLADYILPIIDKYIDPGQCGGLKKLSVSHYLVKLLDFAHKTLDKKHPTLCCAMY